MGLSTNRVLAATLNNGAADLDMSAAWAALSDTFTCGTTGEHMLVWTLGTTAKPIQSTGAADEYRLCLTTDAAGLHEVMLDVATIGAGGPGGTGIKSKTFVSSGAILKTGVTYYAWLYGSASDTAVQVSLEIWRESEWALAAGVALSATGLDAVTATPAAGVPSTFRDMLVWLYRRFAQCTNTKTGAAAGTIEVKNAAGAVLTTQTYSVNSTTLDIEEPT